MKIHLALFTSLLLLGNVCNAFSQVWHTTPDKWKEPRTFHSNFDNKYENRIRISQKIIDKTTLEESNKDRVFSSNKAYWFVIISPDTMKFGPWSTKIEIFNERNHIIEIELVDHAATYTTTVKWINEKLLYIEFWWGRVLGTYFVFDVEKENIVAREMINDGSIPFQQWQQGKQK